jgi:peptide/nickel transport system substrate-binding protein
VVELRWFKLLVCAAFVSTLSVAATRLGYAGAADNTLVVGSLTDPQTLDPASGTLGTDIPFLYPLYDRLIDFEPKTLDLRPGLATSWRWSDDRRALELKLRSGVKFHDGTPFDAAAVKTNIEYFKGLRKNLDLDGVTAVEVVDPQTVLLRLDKPNSTIPGLLAERAGMMLSPAALEKYGKDFGQHPVGTGPFMFKEMAAGKSVVYEKFPDYWNKGEPKLGAIEFRVIRNATSLVSALQSGQLDYAANIDPINLPVLQRNSNLRVGVEPTIAFGIINLNSGMPPLNDVRVRRAIAMAIDRQALANAAFGAALKAVPANLPSPPNYWPSTPALERHFTYRPEEAKKLLAEAGYPDGITFSLCAPASAGTPLPAPKLVDIMREQMKLAGIKVESQQVASNAACVDLFNKKAMPTFMATWSGRPDPAITYAQVLGTKTAYNVGQTQFGKAEDVIARLYATSDRAEQKKLMDELNQLWIDHVPMIALYYYVNVVAYNAKLSGEQPNLLGRPFVRTLSFNK